jgi:hypothetical protein
MSPAFQEGVEMRLHRLCQLVCRGARSLFQVAKLGADEGGRHVSLPFPVLPLPAALDCPEKPINIDDDAHMRTEAVDGSWNLLSHNPSKTGGSVRFLRRAGKRLPSPRMFRKQDKFFRRPDWKPSQQDRIQKAEDRGVHPDPDP